MKKTLKKILFAPLIFLAAAFAQNISENVSNNASELSQSLIPLEVFVGDEAELRYSFRSAVDFFPFPLYNADRKRKGMDRLNQMR